VWVATDGQPVDRLGFRPGQVVQEIGWDEDVDSDLRAQIERAIEAPLVDVDYDEVVDTVLLWWREEDGDLSGALVDAIALLADHGTIWVLTPKPGRPGHVDAEDIAEAAPIAGLQHTTAVNAATAWQGTRLVAPRAGRNVR